MILWFLRLFPAFRSLEAIHRHTAERAQRLQDELLTARSRCDELARESARLLIERTEEQQKLIDFFAFSCTGRTVHGNQPGTPLAPQADPVPRTPTARDMQAEGYRKFYEDLNKIEQMYKAEVNAANQES